MICNYTTRVIVNCNINGGLPCPISVQNISIQMLRSVDNYQAFILFLCKLINHNK